MRIPGIYVAVQGDLSQLEVDLNRARGMVKAAAESISNDMGNALSGRQVTSGVGSLVTKLSELDRASRAIGVSFQGLGVNLQDLHRLTGTTVSQFEQLQAKFLSANVVKTAERALRDLSSALGLSAQETANLGAQFNLSDQSIRKVTTSLGLAGTASMSLARALGDASAAAAESVRAANAASAGFEGMASRLRAAQAEAKAVEAQMAADAAVAAEKIAAAFNKGLASQKFGFLGNDFGRAFHSPIADFAQGLDSLVSKIDNAFSAIGRYTPRIAAWKNPAYGKQFWDAILPTEVPLDRLNSRVEEAFKAVEVGVKRATAKAWLINRNILSPEDVTANQTKAIFNALTLDAAAKQEKVNAAFGSLGVKSLQQYRQEIYELRQAFKLAGEAATSFSEKERVGQAFIAQAQKLRDSFFGVADTAEKTGAKVEETFGKKIGSAFKNTLIYGAAYQILGDVQQLGREFIAIQGKMDGLRRSFDGIYGSNGAAQFQYVIDTANRYGKSLDSVADSYRKFSAAAEYVGMTTQQSRAVFESVTQAITKVGGSSEDVQGTLLALQQMISKGTVSSEEFRLQFAERVPGAMKMGADALGVTTSEFKRMLEQGQIVAKDFIPKLTTQLDVFSKGWEKAADGIEANTQRALNSFKLLAENRYIKDAINNILQFGDSSASALNKGTQAWGDLFAAKTMKSRGLLASGGSFAEAQDFISRFNQMDDESKLNIYKKRRDEIRAQMRGIAVNEFIGNTKLAERNRNYDNLKSQAEGLDSDARWLEARLGVQRELDGLTKSMHSMAVSGSDDLGITIDKVLELQKYLEGLTGRPYKLNFVKEESLSDIDALISRVDSAWQKTAGYTMAAASKNQEQAKQDVAELEEQLRLRKDQLQYASGEQLHKAILDDIDLYTKALEKATASEIDASKKLHEAAKVLQMEQLERTDSFTGTSPSDFLDLGMKQRSRLTNYYEELIKSGYWTDIHDTNAEKREVAGAKQQNAWQKYLDGVKSDQMEVLRRQQQGQAFVENTDASMRTLYDSLTGNSEKDTEKTARWFTKAINDAKIAMADAKGDLAPYRQELEKLYAVYDQFMRAAQIKDFTTNIQKQATVLRDLAGYLYSPQMDRQASWLQNYAQYVSELNSGDAAIRSTAQPKWDAYQTFAGQEYARKLGEGGKLSGDYWEGEYEKLKQHLEAVKQETDDEVAYRIYATQKFEELEKQKLEVGVGYATSFSSYLRGQVSLEMGLYQGAHSRQLEEWRSYYEDVKGFATSFYDTLKSGVTDALDGLFTGKAEEAWKNMLASLRKQFLQFLVNIAFDFAKHNFFKPALEQMIGGGSATSITSIGSGATPSRGGSAIVVSAPSVEPLREYDLPDVAQKAAAAVSSTPAESKASKTGPIWFTHNNPGNIRSLKGGFNYYASMEDGVRGLSEWISRNGARGYDTVGKIVNRYAPPNENDTDKYIKVVTGDTGFDRNEKLDYNNPDILEKLIRAMIRVETGKKNAVSDDVLYRATHTPGKAQLAGQVNDYGLAGKDASWAIFSAASSYGILGVQLGNLGAQTVLSKIDTSGGIWSALTGENTVNAWNNVSQFSPSAATLGLVTGDGKLISSDVLASLSGGSATASDLRASGVTETQVAEYLQSRGMTAVSAASTTSAAAAQQTNAVTSKEGTNFNASDLLKNGSSSPVDKLDQWGFENFGIGSITGEQVGNSVPAFQGMNATGWTGSTAGLGTMAAGALTGAATGLSVSSLIYPNGTATAAGTIGGALGGALGSALGSFAGPVGAVVGSVVGSLLGGSETKSTKKTGSGITVTLVNGNLSQQGYSTYSTTTSGLGGSTNTTHSKAYDTVGDPELERAFSSALEKYNNQSWRSLVGMNLSTSALRSVTFPFQFDYDESNSSFAAKAVANYTAALAIQASGLQEEFDAVAKSGEVYVDELERISTAYNKGSIAALTAGTSLEKLANTTSTVFQGDWFSEVADYLGGNDQAVSAFSTYTKYGLTATEGVNNALTAYATKAGEAIAQIGDASVNIDNFWAKYKETMNSGSLSAEQFSYWANAASYMASFSDEQYMALNLMETINSVRIAQLKEEMTAVQMTRVMVDGLNTSVSSAYSTYKSMYDSLTSTLQSITWSNLSPNTPNTTFTQQTAYYQYLKDKVNSEDSSSLTWSSDIQKLTSFSQTYLTAAKAYYGYSSKYYEIYNDVTSELTSLQTTTKTELDVLQEQLAAQYEVINRNQAQIDQLELVNTNLQLLGAGLDGLGSSIAAGLEALGASMSWSPSIGDAIAAAISAQADTIGTLAEAASVDTSSLIDVSYSSLAAISGYASGGYPSAGELALVGEDGPELIHFGSNARVYTASDTAGMLNGQRGADKESISTLRQIVGVLSAGFSEQSKKLDSVIDENQRLRLVAEREAARP